jgi:meso-butanediol dehydrogenase/(S,S)-butanediol dehydrogenase/diacetyl reductase
MDPNTRLTDKIVIVTGGGSGIGAAAALRFAAEGATVVIAGRTKTTLDQVAAQAPGRIEVRVTDLAEEAATTELVDEVARAHGQLDVLVNNAGPHCTAGARTPAPNCGAGSWPSTWTRCSSPPAPPSPTCATRGAIVNVASVSGLGRDWTTAGKESGAARSRPA